MTENVCHHPVVGRFAPSPTGPLHFGSLVAALGSYLFARRSGGRWLLRIEDLDPPRVIPEAADRQIRCLEQLGFTWDGEIVYQSRRLERYRQVLEQLNAQGQVFACSCSRGGRGTGLSRNLSAGDCRLQIRAGDPVAG